MPQVTPLTSQVYVRPARRALPSLSNTFRRFSTGVSATMGHPLSFVVSLGIVGAWAVTGPHFRYSDTWQLVINTGTSVLTFLMVFLIQNTQNRDTKAIHLKLDELIRSVSSARNSLVCLERLSDEEIDQLKEELLRACTDRAADTSKLIESSKS